MKLKLGIFALVAMCAVAMGVYAAPAEAPQGEAVVVQEAAVVPSSEAVVLPWEDPFLLLTNADEIPQEPQDPTETQIIPNVWCCKPDGNCAKIKQTKCTNIGGVQYRTEAGCLNDPNC